MTTTRLARTRSEGQWALGEREPLNDSERIKHDEAPLNVRTRIENIYAKQGFDSIDKSDLRGRFRWMGLYTQREQGYDGTWTLRNFLKHRHEGERFPTWAMRSDEEQLR